MNGSSLLAVFDSIFLKAIFLVGHTCIREFIGDSDVALS
uniref:Uncharacterized protein n=1 Tax=Rhizophora mucronata TaxID=61149 RepID=A0A2P2K780_RHIMU